MTVNSEQRAGEEPQKTRKVKKLIFQKKIGRMCRLSSFKDINNSTNKVKL